MMKFQGVREGRLTKPEDVSRLGDLSVRRGARLLPDVPTAALAMLRGYQLGGFYERPLEGKARELGYTLLEDATPAEWEEIQRLIS